ncbi:MAG TPA: substrate-binding domain-containing protein [Ilumatobacteraceae bacterium]|nr:substrate-binding domain-containing protein [Ilumatobacteraceae bacterium]
MRKSTRSFATIATTLALLTTACGGDDDDASGDTTGADDTAAAGDTEPADVASTGPADTGTTESAGTEPAGTGAAGENPFGATLAEGEFGESYLPDETLLEQALGGAASLPTDDMQRNIALAAVSRASMEVDEDLALECWQNNGCETGTGGELKVGLADGFGGNVARQLFKMEFILQALTYPEIGEIAYTDANLDAQKAISDVRSLVAQDYDVILSYPDAGEALVPAYRAATEEGSQVVLWSNANIGEPGTDYLTFSGSDICAIGTKYGEIMNEALPDGGQIAFLGGTPGNTQSPVWQDCEREALNDNIEVVAVADTSWTRQGALEAAGGIISQYPDLDGWSYDYGDAFVGVIRAYEAAGIPMDVVATIQSDDNPMLCAWKEVGNPNFVIHHYVALFTQGRIGLTAAMMKLQGADVPPELIFQAELKTVDENSCRTDIPDDGSPSTLISGELQSRMYPS